MDKQEYIYNCEKCNFHTNAKSMWEKHIITGKHTSGSRATRCDKKLLDKCPHCNYKPPSYTNMKHHILNIHSTKEERKKEFKFYCENCDFGSFGKQPFDIHSKSEKHMQMT